MSKFSTSLALACCFIFASVNADQVPATGKLLVATDEVRGPYFAQTVILLLHHDETGALGLVVNRPIDGSAIESLQLHEDLAAYRDTFYWGGPVSQATVRALLRTDTPPEDAVQIFDAVYVVNMDEDLLATASNASKLRFFVGYASWSPGQLENELVFDSWQILPATEEIVFAEDTDAIWRTLLPPRQFRAAAARYRLSPPLRLISRLTVEAARPSELAIVRIEHCATTPLEISSRSASVSDCRERRLSRGRIPPNGET